MRPGDAQIVLRGRSRQFGPQQAQQEPGAGGVDAISLAYELEGVIVDVEQGNGFDDICLNTIKRVRGALFAATSAGTTSRRRLP